MSHEPPLDLMILGGRVVDVFRERVFEGWVGVRDGRFIYVEEGAPRRAPEAQAVFDANGAVIVPGLVDTHMHIESSLVSPRRFAEAVVPEGTTTLLADPHEIANVAGEAGIRWMIRASEHLPLRIFFAIPSCVPSTSADLEWTQGGIDEHTVSKLAEEPSVIALGEVMDYRGALAGRKNLMKILEVAQEHGLLIEGHVPSLDGVELSYYLSLGVSSDHTLATPEKILEQVSKGVVVMVQMKSLLPENIATILELPDRSRILLVTDDTNPALLSKEGHLSAIVRHAVDLGIPPVEAISMATIRPATYLGLRRVGAIAPGWSADFMLLRDLVSFPPRSVYRGGKLVAKDGTLISKELPSPPEPLGGLVNLGPFTPEDFQVFPEGIETETFVANAVSIENERNTLTDLERVKVEVKDGQVLFTPNDGLTLVAVFTRDGAAHSVGIAKNTGLQEGAYASTFAHDSHNLLVVGRSLQAMAVAATAACEDGGGIAVANDEKVVARLPLPIAGIFSDAPLEDVVRDFTAIEDSLRELGVKHHHPFLLFSTLALSVSPRYKFSDKGVIDVEARGVIPPFAW